MTRTLSILFLSCLTALGQVSFSFGSLSTVARGYATNQAAGGGNSLLTSLSAYWRFDEESGNRADYHSTNDLTDINSCLYTAGVITNAADFEDDTDEYLTRTRSLSPQLFFGTDSAFTVAVWINIETDPASGTGGIIGNGDNDEGFVLAKRTSGDVIRLYWTGQSGSTTHDIAAPAAAGWHLIFAWHDPVADVIGLQMDDDAPSTTAWSDGSKETTGQNFAVGSYGSGGGTTFDGQIDEAGFWLRVLTAGERAALYNSGNGMDYADFE